MTKVAKQPKAETTLALVEGSVFDHLEQVKQKLSEIQAVTDSPYKTPGRINTGGNTVDVKTETNVENLVVAYATVKTKIQVVESAYEELGITNHKVVRIDGGTTEEWKADITLRLNIIQNQAKLDKLNKIKDGLTELMGKEEKAALLMNELKNI